MSAEDEKARKLKEIQERLAEIQGKSAESKKPEKPTSDFPSKPKSVPEQNNPAPPEENLSKKVEPVAAKKEPETSKPDAEKSDEQKKKNEISPLIKATFNPPSPTEKIEPESKTSTSVSSGWSQNKVAKKETEAKATPVASKPKTRNKEEKKPVAKNKMSKILSVISLAITLSVAAYIIYSYSSSPAKEDVEIIEAEIPVVADDQVEPGEVVHEEPEISNENTSSPSTIVDEEVTQKAAQRVNEKRIERKKDIENKPVPKKVVSSDIEKTSVPTGFIISYVSNSKEDAAASNVYYLKQQGFAANYYYMRDKDKNGPPLYKVYLGPYSNESEAFPDFKKIIKLNDKAFILKMN